MTATFDQPWPIPLSEVQEQAIREAREQGRREAIAEVVAWLHSQDDDYNLLHHRTMHWLIERLKRDYLSASLPPAKEP